MKTVPQKIINVVVTVEPGKITSNDNLNNNEKQKLYTEIARLNWRILNIDAKYFELLQM